MGKIVSGFGLPKYETIDASNLYFFKYLAYKTLKELKGGKVKINYGDLISWFFMVCKLFDIGCTFNRIKSDGHEYNPNQAINKVK